MRTSITTLLFFIAVVFGEPAAAQDRSLYWDAMTVHVQVDAQGMLHVTERQSIVFDGAWNGGERSFELRSWQSLSLQGIAEIDPQTQARTPLREDSDLDDVGDYRLDGTVLRWRARSADDPPFANTTKTYEIAYSIAGTLFREGDHYVLEHDLAFPERSGTIRTFDATLELDPAWQGDNVPTRWHEENLQPGEHVFAHASLRHVGVEQPTAVAREMAIPTTSGSPMLRYGLLGGMIVFMLAQIIALLRREKQHGRLEPPIPLDEIDERWLRDNVFDRAPEVVGAAWDLDTAESEVAALLARLAQQGALKTEVRSTGSGWFKRDVMYMELLCERDRLAAHERELIDKLFIGGSRMTDTDKIRKHYSKSGFTPAEYIKKGIEAQLPMIFANRLAIPLWARLTTAALLVAAIVTLVISMIGAPGIEAAVMPAVFVLFGLFVLSIVFAYLYRANVYELRGRMLRTLIGLGAMYGVVAFLLLAGVVALIPLAMVGVTLWALGLMNSVFNMMRVRERNESLQLRRKLSSARAYFERELKSPSPALKDEWFPYLLAFGLGPKIDKWFKKIAPASTRAMTRTSTVTGGGSSSGSASAPPTWTGGGGTFGGGGASGAWSSAVGSIAGGVAKPSSSGSGGRSSSGGSSRSSGGGGGGGW
jgi:uncharacterized membrane protein YgcG